FSNFSGLNCVEDLAKVAQDLSRLLNPGARAVVCMIGRFVPWEIAWFVAHGDARRAFRRLRRLEPASVDGHAVPVRYFSVREIRRAFSPGFHLLRKTGVGVAVPPSYMERWARRFPSATRMLARVDPVLGRMPMLRALGDCVLLTFARKPERQGW